MTSILIVEMRLISCDLCQRISHKLGILMQEEERRLNLKPQSVDLALVARKNFYKGKGGPQ